MSTENHLVNFLDKSAHIGRVDPRRVDVVHLDDAKTFGCLGNVQDKGPVGYLQLDTPLRKVKHPLRRVRVRDDALAHFVEA